MLGQVGDPLKTTTSRRQTAVGNRSVTTYHYKVKQQITISLLQQLQTWCKFLLVQQSKVPILPKGPDSDLAPLHCGDLKTVDTYEMISVFENQKAECCIIV